MMANPFEDPDVQQAANNQNTSNVYGGSNAYGNGNDYGDSGTTAAPQLNQAQQEIAVSIGTQVATQVGTKVANDIKSDYNQSKAQQSDVYSAPENPNFCNKLILWLPIRTVAWFAGLAFLVLPWIDNLFNQNVSFIDIIISAYIFIFGVIIVIIESPVFKLTRKPQLKIFFWMRILSRMYGRSLIYMFFSVLCFTRWFTTITIAGFYILIISLLMLITSRQAGTKYRRIFEFIAGGSDPNNIEELQGKFIRKFDELDRVGGGKIGSLEIVSLANQAGRTISNSERHAIQTFLDESCNGHVSKEDFVKQFLQNNGSPESGCCILCCKGFYL